jgi:hypothetical protein
MASEIATSLVLLQDASPQARSASPDSDDQRGRKMGRQDHNDAPSKSPSPAFRGRRRYRSISVMAVSGSRNDASRSFQDPSSSRSPSSRNRLLWMFVGRGRSQSSSRSRTPNTRTIRRRRRQRTISRGRDHRLNRVSESANGGMLDAQANVLVVDKMECGAQKFEQQDLVEEGQ